MQVSFRSSSLMFAFLLSLGSAAANLMFATISWGQTSSVAKELNTGTRSVSVSANPETGAADALPQNQSSATLETNLQASTVESSQGSSSANSDSDIEATVSNLEFPSTRAEDLVERSPNVPIRYGEMTLPQPLSSSGIRNSDLFAQITPNTSSTARNTFRFRLGSRVPVPSVLQGVTRPRTVLPGSGASLGLSAIARVEHSLGSGEVAVELVGGEHALAFDLGYTSSPSTLTDSPRTGFGVNFFNQRSFFPAFREGDRDVDLPNGDTPWLHRLGGGIETFIPLAPGFDSALGISYQRVSVRDDVFTSDVNAVDELGNQLTVDRDGIDDLLTLNFQAQLDRLDDPLYPTRGSKLRFGADEGLTLGSEDIAFSRLAANFTQYIPFPLFGFDEGPRTLVLNLQSGVIFGDVPPYEGFNLGGEGSVRGYRNGEVGTGSRFVQATAEYRFPIFSFAMGRREIPVAGAFFVDYGTDLGSADDVIGDPAEARDKPGDGLGFGVGLRIRSPFGPVRVEFAVNGDGGNELHITTSERF